MELSEDIDETVKTNPLKRGRGRPKKVTQVTKREFVEDGDGEEQELPGLFATSDIEDKSIVRIRVVRKDPHEGMLGYLEDPNATETEILERWGGSQYRLEGLNSGGVIKAARMVKIAGDPIFVSLAAEQQWRRSRGLPPVGGQQSDNKPMSFTEMLTFMRELNVDKERSETERREREAKERREHEERMRKLELEAEDRRRKDEQEREERRRRDDESRDRARTESANLAMQMQQQFMQSMIASTKQAADQAIAFVKQSTAQTAGTPNAMMDAVKMVVAIKSAFAGDTPEAGEDDPLSLVIKHGHEWLSGIGNAVTGAIREVKGGGIAGQTQPAQLPPATQSTPDGGLTIPATSPLAGKLSTLVEKIAASGRDPETVLAGVVDSLNATLDGQPVPVAAPPPSPGQSPAGPGFKPYTDPNPLPTSAAPATSVNGAVNGHTRPVSARAKFILNKTEGGNVRLSFR